MVLGFSGKIGSGKSTLSEMIAKELGVIYSSFGDYVRKIAEKRDIPLTRINLQDLGHELLTKDIHRFCSDVLKDAGWSKGNSIVVDGIRHLEVIHELNKIVSPDSIKLIYLDIANEALRRSRTSHRQEDMTSGDSHPTENQVQDKSLMQAASFVIDAEKPIETLRSEIVSWVKDQA
jgi:dephospho-CoA kinase